VEVSERKWLRPLQFALVLVVTLTVVTWGTVTLLNPETLPVRSVQLEGIFKFMKEEDLQKAIAPYAKGGFFTVNIEQVQEAVHSLAWVDDVSVRRVWPDTLRIKIREQQPMARWRDDGLLNIRGEHFAAEQSLVADLPVLYGPNGFEQALARRYTEIDGLLKNVELKVAGLYVDQRRSWRVRLTNNIELKLGRTGVSPRLQRFVRTYPQVLAKKAASINTVDLRYTNGFAVQWRPEDKAIGLDAEQARTIKKGAPPGVLRGVESHV